MSELAVGSIAGLASNGFVVDVASGSSLDLSNGATLPAGSVVQVVETQKSTLFETTSETLVDVTNLSVTVTPKSSSSKFLIFLHGLTVSHTGTNGSVIMAIARDSTDIGQEVTYQDNTGTIIGNVSVTFLDSPGTDSDVTYKGRVKRNVVTGTARVNRSSITVMEIAG